MKKTKLILGFGLINLILCFSCEDIIIKPAGSDQNMEDFEATWNRVNDVYPFLDFKMINWDSIYTVYLPRVEAAQGDEFYFVLGDLLAELKDGHVYYKIPGGSEVYPYYPARHFKDRHAYSPFVVRTYFDKELKVTASKSAEYEILPENIGYVFLSDFHENYLFNEFPGIIEYLKNTKSLIIDIRQKRGGSSLNIDAVVSRFITYPLEWPKLHILGEIIDIESIKPKKPTYTNPVVVIINGSTFSAGEWTTEIMKQLSTVTVIGDTTGGGGGTGSNQGNAKSEFKLPSGKIISTVTGYFERYDGQLVEWNGVPPDIRVEQTEEDIKNGRDKQLEYAINLLK